MQKMRLRTTLFFLLFNLCAGESVFAFDRQTAGALASYIKAGIYERQGDIDRAVQEYKKALKVESKNAAVHLSLAAAYSKKRDILLAIEETTRAVSCDPEAVEPHAILALLYFSQNKLEEAGKEYEIALQNAVKLNPKDTNVLKSLGILYLQKRDLIAAENAFKSIIEISSTDYDAHFYLANTLEEQKNRDGAVKELKIVLELKPDYHQALNYLGYLYVEENKHLEEAEKLIKKALEIEPDNGAYIDSLGWLYYKKGNNKEAIKELEKAVGLMEDPVIFDHLGDVYFRIQNFDGARGNWEKSLKLDPEQSAVKKKLEGLASK